MESFVFVSITKSCQFTRFMFGGVFDLEFIVCLVGMCFLLLVSLAVLLYLHWLCLYTIYTYVYTYTYMLSVNYSEKVPLLGS